MINADGDNVDLYIPRKCSWTNRLITAKDKASVQLNVGHLDANGVYDGRYTTVALALRTHSLRKMRSPASKSASTAARSQPSPTYGSALASSADALAHDAAATSARVR